MRVRAILSTPYEEDTLGPARSSRTKPAERRGANVAVILGRLSRPGAERVLPSGDRLLSLELSVSHAGQRAETLPVVVFEPPSSASHLDAGEEVLVIGRVRRRFFRAAGTLQARTEVVARTVVATRRAGRARKALALAMGELSQVLDGQVGPGFAAPESPR